METIDWRLSSRFVAAERPTLITLDRDGDGLPDSIVTLEYAGPEQGLRSTTMTPTASSTDARSSVTVVSL